MKSPEWQYDEMNQVGADFKDPQRAASYDERIVKLGYVPEKIVKDIVAGTGLSGDDTVLDMGAGTGLITIELAKLCRKVIAVDPAPAMLHCLEEKARRENVANIEVVRASFLTYRHEGPPVDVIVCKSALHHLPDFWKGVALKRMAAMLKIEGKLYIGDMIYSFPVEEHEKHFTAFLDSLGRMGDDEFVTEIKMHFREEFSTFDWIMEGLMRWAGFQILKKQGDALYSDYMCLKRGER